MKSSVSLRLLSLSLLAFALLLPSCGRRTTGMSGEDGEEELLWSEEFDGASLDTAVWSKTPRGTSDWNNLMSDREELYELTGGTLRLKVVPNRGRDYQDTVPFLTGGVWTKHRLGFSKGRVEIRARFDEHQGFWPALWLLSSAPNAWPMGGEIDMMEHLNRDTLFYSTIHTQYTLDGNEEPRKFATHSFKSGDFNVYSASFGSDSVTFAVNGEPFFAYHRLYPPVEHQFPFGDRPFYVILSAQMGGSWVGEPAPIAEPLILEIDYVRYYRTREGGEVADLRN